jgi:hypothetical protein
MISLGKMELQSAEGGFYERVCHESQKRKRMYFKESKILRVVLS